MSYNKQLKRLSGDDCLLHSLSCCNGKVYALSQENCIMPLLFEIHIMVKAGEVVIRLILFAGCPHSLKHCGFDYMYFLRGSNTELFCIMLAFKYGVETYDTAFSCVTLHKLDMSCINWAGLKWDLTGLELEGLILEQEDANMLYKSMDLWEEMEDLKDANFFVDLARDNSVVYSPAIASAGGKIHIRSRMGKIIYSYNLNDRTILLNSTFPPPVLPTSHVSVWECRLAGDYYPKSEQEVEGKDREIVARSVNDDDVEHKELQLLDLPLGVLDMVMEFCTGLEYLNFRATCKRCHFAAPVLQWRGEATLKRLQNYSLLSPWLMVVDKKQNIVTFEDPLSGYKYFMKGLPHQMDDRDRIYSGYGVLLFNSEYGLEFCNPFTNAVHDLPDVVGFRLSWLSFSAPPTSPDCMVVGFGEKGIYIHRVGGEKSWRLVSLDNNYDDYRFHFYFPTLYGQDLYALDDEGELHVFKNLDQEDFSWEEDVVEAPRGSCRYPIEYFLTKCDQHLLLIFVDHFGESVEVFKLNDLKNGWEKINGIGRRMIFISDNACLCRKAEMSEMENKIFFARLYNKNGKVVFCSFETGMYHTSNAKNIEESFEDFVGTKHYPFNPHAWIEPSWS